MSNQKIRKNAQAILSALDSPDAELSVVIVGDDEIAGLWRGFICHSHYDGVLKWEYAGSDRASAAERLRRLNGRPQFVCHEGSGEATKRYLKKACPVGSFTFLTLPYRNHTDAWVLRDIPERKILRRWVRDVLDEKTEPTP